MLNNRLFICFNVDLEEFAIDTMSQCFDYGGDWVKKDFTYDNIADGLFYLLTVANTEGWIGLL